MTNLLVGIQWSLVAWFKKRVLPKQTWIRRTTPAWSPSLTLTMYLPTPNSFLPIIFSKTIQKIRNKFNIKRAGQSRSILEWSSQFILQKNLRLNCRSRFKDETTLKSPILSMSSSQRSMEWASWIRSSISYSITIRQKLVNLVIFPLIWKINRNRWCHLVPLRDLLAVSEDKRLNSSQTNSLGRLNKESHPRLKKLQNNKICLRLEKMEQFKKGC